jgi:RimJ/RimL family protein N-acetyltransferase
LALPISVALRDGRQVRLRGIDEHDREALLAAFDRLSPDSRYTRFMMAMRNPPTALLEAAMHPIPGREFALVAVSGEGGAERIVGSARYVGVPGSDHCEFGITVADDWHGVGLARRLLALLIEAAAAQGFHCIEGYVLAANTPMRRLAKRLGFVDSECEDDATLRTVSRSLAAGGCAAP